MFAAPRVRLTPADARPFHLAIIAGLACAFAIGKVLPLTMDAISTVVAPLCAASDPAGSALDTVEPIASYALPNVPGKRITIVRVFYGPGGFTRAHRHAGSVTAYIASGGDCSIAGNNPSPAGARCAPKSSTADISASISRLSVR